MLFRSRDVCVRRDAAGRANGPIYIEIKRTSLLSPTKGEAIGTWHFHLWYEHADAGEPLVFEFNPSATGKMKVATEVMDTPFLMPRMLASLLLDRLLMATKVGKGIDRSVLVVRPQPIATSLVQVHRSRPGRMDSSCRCGPLRLRLRRRLQLLLGLRLRLRFQMHLC